MAYQTYIPQITSAVFSANPTTINTRVVLTVKASDVLKILEPELIYSGEIRAGEVD
jgi:hypothetical protein